MAAHIRSFHTYLEATDMWDCNMFLYGEYNGYSAFSNAVIPLSYVYYNEECDYPSRYYQLREVVVQHHLCRVTALLVDYGELYVA